MKLPTLTCTLASDNKTPAGQTNQPEQWEEVFQSVVADIGKHYKVSDRLSDILSDSLSEHLPKALAEAEARGKQEGANIAMAVKLSSFDQHKTYVAGLARDLLPVNHGDTLKAEKVKAHNEAVLKLMNIKN